MSFSRINTNLQSMQAFTSLQNNSSELAMRRQRLATGLRINSAEDDSAGYSIANKLEAKTRGQGQALKNIGDAKGMLTVAEGSLDSTMDILQTMKEKAVQASNDSMGTKERAAIQGQLNELASEIGDTLGGAEFNGTKLFGGSETLENGATGESLNFQVGASSSDTFGVELTKRSEKELGIQATTTSEDASSVSYGGTDTEATETFDIATGSNSGFKITDSGGTVIADDVADLSGQTYTNDAGDFSVTFADDYAATNGDSVAVSVGNVDVSSLDVETDSASRASAIDTIDTAIQTVSDEMAGLGDAQKRLTFKQDNLETAQTNYEASRSRIMDADFAKEQMQISKLQILQQAGTATFAQANASSQAVLSFLG